MYDVISRQTNWAGIHQPAVGSSLPGGSLTRGTVKLHQLSIHLEEMVFLREHYQQGALPSRPTKPETMHLICQMDCRERKRNSRDVTERSCSQTVVNTAHVTHGHHCSLPGTSTTHPPWKWWRYILPSKAWTAQLSRAPPSIGSHGAMLRSNHCSAQ